MLTIASVFSMLKGFSTKPSASHNLCLFNKNPAVIKITGISEYFSLCFMLLQISMPFEGPRRISSITRSGCILSISSNKESISQVVCTSNVSKISGASSNKLGSSSIKSIFLIGICFMMVDVYLSLNELMMRKSKQCYMLAYLRHFFL